MDYGSFRQKTSNLGYHEGVFEGLFIVNNRG
jgi:hypothetical protein